MIINISRYKKYGKPLPLVLLLSACTSFTPIYEKPKVALPPSWTDVALSEQASAEEADVQLNWRHFYQDPRLQKLIAAALEHNHDLKQAALNIRIAQAQYDISSAAETPSVGLNASANRSRTPRDLAGRSSVRDAYSVGVGVAGFELDFFGRVQALNEQALEQYLATYEARDSAQLALISAVAKTYLQARIVKAQMDLAQEVLASRQESYRLSSLLSQAGLITAQDLHGVKSQIDAARANFAEAKGGYQKALNALSRLVGKPIESLNLPPAGDLARQFNQLKLPKGIPADVLQRRPDIREAEYKLKAANANIGAARALLYPRISLTGSLGFGSTELGQLLKQPNSSWKFGPSLDLPIFDRNQRKNNIVIAETRQKQLIENYQKVVQGAFYDVADALAAREALSEQYQAQLSGMKSVRERLRLVNLRFKHGVSNALDLLDAQRESYAASQGLLATELKILHNQVDLFTAMGGGLDEYDTQLPKLDK